MLPWLRKAEEMVRAAGTIARRGFQHPQILREKAFADVVTQGDQLVEDQISESIKREFPGHGLISEESGEHNADAEYVWILDPIDGSKYFARRIPVYSISLALRQRDELVLGVVYSPETNQLFSACADHGAHLNGEPIRCSRVASLDEAFVGVEIPNRHSDVKIRRAAIQTVSRLVDEVERVRIFGVSALGLCYCALGGFDAYVGFNPSTKIWDLAGGLVIMREAGGKITLVPQQHLLAGPPQLHDQLAEILAAS